MSADQCINQPFNTPPLCSRDTGAYTSGLSSMSRNQPMDLATPSSPDGISQKPFPVSAPHKGTDPNHNTSPGLTDGDKEDVVHHTEPHSRGGSLLLSSPPSFDSTDCRRDPLLALNTLRGRAMGGTPIQIMELLRPVTRASSATLAILTDLPRPFVEASLRRLHEYGFVRIQDRVDHRGRLLWGQLTEQGRQALTEHRHTDGGHDDTR